GTCIEWSLSPGSGAFSTGSSLPAETLAGNRALGRGLPPRASPAKVRYAIRTKSSPRGFDTVSQAGIHPPVDARMHTYNAFHNNVVRALGDRECLAFFLNNGSRPAPGRRCVDGAPGGGSAWRASGSGCGGTGFDTASKAGIHPPGDARIHTHNAFHNNVMRTVGARDSI